MSKKLDVFDLVDHCEVVNQSIFTYLNTLKFNRFYRLLQDYIEIEI